ncbi:hypothetical protein SESBI_42873 [Sesbania bispinosa]|nr:hypothetical protein SESBI_42873 [Sesbania bispinosa]
MTLGPNIDHNRIQNTRTMEKPETEKYQNRTWIKRKRLTRLHLADAVAAGCSSGEGQALFGTRTGGRLRRNVARNGKSLTQVVTDERWRDANLVIETVLLFGGR